MSLFDSREEIIIGTAQNVIDSQRKRIARLRSEVAHFKLLNKRKAERILYLEKEREEFNCRSVSSAKDSEKRMKGYAIKTPKGELLNKEIREVDDDSS